MSEIPQTAQPQQEERGGDPPEPLQRWRQDLVHAPLDRGLGFAIASHSPAGWAPADVLRASEEAPGQPGPGQRR